MVTEVSKETPTQFSHPDRHTIQSLFNAIPEQYDFLNSFFSFGLDAYWRRQLVNLVAARMHLSVLDLGVGTGKSLRAFLKHRNVTTAVGCDFSAGMLQQASQKFDGDRAPSLVSCDFHHLPFKSESFDVVTGSFILRSVQELDVFFKEVRRVLKRGGHALFLELTRPTNYFLWRVVYQPYLKFYIPTVGRLFSRHEHAYRFLSESIQAFVEPKTLTDQMNQLGFRGTFEKPMTFGSVTIVGAIKNAGVNV